MTLIGAGDVPVATAEKRFEKLRGLKVLSRNPGPIGGFPGRTYEILVPGEHVLLEAIDIGLIGRDIPRGKHQVTFVDVRGHTLMISLDAKTKADRAEAERVLRSFRFSE